MKKGHMIILAFSAVLIMYSCGGNKEGAKKETAQQVTIKKSVTFTNQYLSIELPGDWKVSQYGAHNNEGLSIFSFKAGNSGDNMKDAFNKDHEPIGEIEETTVDGLPALTRKQKFMQNEMKISRVWLIDDGRNIISFNVAAAENVFNDKKAQKLVEKVKVKNHYTDNNQKAQKASMVKPNDFPQKTVIEIADIFSQNTVLNDESIEKSIKAFKILKKFNGQVDESRKTAIADSILKANGIDDFEKITTQVIPVAFSSLSILKLMEKAESSDNEIEHNMAVDMIKSFITQNNVSEADLKYTFNNWDKVLELTKFEEKK